MQGADYQRGPAYPAMHVAARARCLHSDAPQWRDAPSMHAVQAPTHGTQQRHLRSRLPAASPTSQGTAAAVAACLALAQARAGSLWRRTFGSACWAAIDLGARAQHMFVSMKALCTCNVHPPTRAPHHMCHFTSMKALCTYPHAMCIHHGRPGWEIRTSGY